MRILWGLVALAVVALLFVSSRMIAILCAHTHLLQRSELLGKQLVAMTFLLPAVTFGYTAARWLDRRLRGQTARSLPFAVVFPTALAAVWSFALRTALLLFDHPVPWVDGYQPSSPPWVAGAEHTRCSNKQLPTRPLIYALIVMVAAYGADLLLDRLRRSERLQRALAKRRERRQQTPARPRGWVPRWLAKLGDRVKRLPRVGKWLANRLEAPPSPLDRAAAFYGKLTVFVLAIGVFTGGWLGAGTQQGKLSEVIVGLLPLAFGYGVEARLPCPRTGTQRRPMEHPNFAVVILAVIPVFTAAAVFAKLKFNRRSRNRSSCL